MWTFGQFTSQHTSRRCAVPPLAMLKASQLEGIGAAAFLLVAIAGFEVTYYIHSRRE